MKRTENTILAEKIIRENLNSRKGTQIDLSPEDAAVTVTVEDARKGGCVTVNIADVITPLTEGVIYDTVGLPLKAGLKGDFNWPMSEMSEATLAEENVPLGDAVITFDKFTASPERIGIAVPVSVESLHQTDGLLETIIGELLPQAAAKLANKILFSTEKVNSSTNIEGPFARYKKAHSESMTPKKFRPDYAEYGEMKLNVLKSKADGKHLCWVMTPTQKAQAELTPSGIGAFPVCKDGKILDIPVFTTNQIEEGFIGLGDWKFQPAGFFGDISLLINPFSSARKGAVDFVFNIGFATKTLIDGAFEVIKVKTAKE